MKKQFYNLLKIVSMVTLVFLLAAIIKTTPVVYGLELSRGLNIDKINDLSESVDGVSQSGAMIYIMTTGDTELGTGFADKEGKFSVKIKKQTPGNRVVIYAAEKITTDGAEDYAPFAMKEIEVEDITPPKAPKVKQNSDGMGISGSAEKKSVLLIYIDGYLVDSKKVSASGRFNVHIPYLTEGMRVEVVAVDSGGRFSPAATIYIY